MKEIKKETKREVIDTRVYYEAYDGTRFDIQEECKKYEDSALCLAKSKVKNLIITEMYEAWDFMGGYEDNLIFGVKLNTKEDADVLKHWLLLDCTYLQKEEYKERRQILFNKIDSAIGDIFLMGVNSGEDWYAINSRKNIINNLNNLDKEQSEDAKSE